MGLSNPSGLPVVVLIVPFVLLFVALYTLWMLLGEVKVRYFARGRPRQRLGMAVCASVVLLIVLQSLGQLTLRDVLTVAAIITVGYLYLARMRSTVSSA